jgi:hypothetical protein
MNIILDSRSLEDSIMIAKLYVDVWRLSEK